MQFLVWFCHRSTFESYFETNLWFPHSLTKPKPKNFNFPKLASNPIEFNKSWWGVHGKFSRGGGLHICYGWKPTQQKVQKLSWKAI